MFKVKLLTGETQIINRLLLATLAGLMDWQIRECGYDPASITAHFLD